MAAHNHEISIWQWNCRGFQGKKSNLQLHIQNLEVKPDIITIQEPMGPVSLTGYKAISQKYIPRKTGMTATLVSNQLTAIQHEFDNSAADYTLTEIIPAKKEQVSLYVLNVYSSPKDQSREVTALLESTTQLAKKGQLVITGDFNAPHVEWGYHKSFKKGNILWNKIQELGLSLLNDPHTATRTGNSISRDTTPDLTLAKNVKNPVWRNTGADLNSDHYILATTLRTESSKKSWKRTKFTDWDKFRKERNQTAPPEIEDIEDWVKSICKSVDSHTSEIPTDAEHCNLDSRLAHMWEARNSLMKRWKRQRLNKRLRSRIAKLESEIERHARQLTQQEWYQTCDSLNGQLGNKKTWHLLRHLLDPTQSKSAAQGQLAAIIHQYPGDGQDFLDLLRKKYLNTADDGETSPQYSGRPNVQLDEPFTDAEVWAALGQLRTTSAAGPDLITNKALRNLDMKSVTALTDYINVCWEAGLIPSSWKHAKVIFIPKPNKKFNVDNLRPISLTSCLGKLMEHVVLNRLRDYTEDHDLMPYSMVGFRRGLSTQDVMLQLSRDILDPSIKSTRAILGLDLKKAFDNVSHNTILKHLADLNPGERAYNYVKAFLENRTVEITIGPLKSNPIRLGNRGTPQGAVLSPFLFNLALIKLPERLNAIENIHHTLYADDVTIWTNRGSEGQIEEALQAAADTVEEEARRAGLECSQPKSELLVLRRSKKPEDKIPIDIKIQGQNIEEVENIRVLGLHISNTPSNIAALGRLESSVHQVARMIRRIANKRRGMEEHDLHKLLQAFVITKITYAFPYLRLKKAEEQKIDILIRHAYKTALGLPKFTANEKLLALGVHNTFSELKEAHLTTQTARLSSTPPGRMILDRLGIEGEPMADHPGPVPGYIRKKIRIKPLPKNMNPQTQQGRREARARAMHRHLQRLQDVIYVDAANYQDSRHRFAICGVPHPRDSDAATPLIAATVFTKNAETAEEAAIAAAIAFTEATTIVSDSKYAITNYAKGRISLTARNILENVAETSPLREIDLVWVPAHAGNPGNEAAHAQARVRAGRAVDSPIPEATGEPLTSYHDHTTHFKLRRRKFPPPHRSLSREQQVAWRRLQTDSFPNPNVYSHIFAQISSPNCRFCGEKATLDHMIWDCKAHPPPPDLMAAPSLDAWLSVKASDDPDTQVKAVEWAYAVRDLHGLDIAY